MEIRKIMEIKYGQDSSWIGPENNHYQGNHIFYFRRKFWLSQMNPSLQVRVSADSRYKLYINGKLVLSGPCKGNFHTWYYETIDLSDFLIQGWNAIAAEVLHFADRNAPDPQSR